MGYFYRAEINDMVKERLEWGNYLRVLPLKALMAGAYLVVMERNHAERIRLWKIFPKLTPLQVRNGITAYNPDL